MSIGLVCSRIVPKVLFVCGISLLVGCQKPQGPEFRSNEVVYLKQERLILEPGQRFDSQRKMEVRTILRSLFGSPDFPRLPEILSRSSEIRNEHSPGSTPFALNKILVSAGAVKNEKDGKSFGLYREHCAHCHGITGDGNGSTAAVLNPYPRDFRLGKFKFKSTPLSKAPTHEDLIGILENGIPGTAMPSFRRLQREELESLVDYVRYLTVQGQFERILIEELSRSPEETLLPPEEVKSPDRVNLDSVQSQAERLYSDSLEQISARWSEAEERKTLVSNPPANLNRTHEGFPQLVARGQELFKGKGSCAQCHIVNNATPNSTVYYDDWTSDWIKSPGVDPSIRKSYSEFLKAGALRPRSIRPRNLEMAAMRGGGEPEKIYLRIANGIEGTPMPSAASTLTSDEIWALVAYVQSLSPDPKQSD